MRKPHFTSSKLQAKCLKVKCIVEKVDNHYLIIFLIMTLISEKYVGWCAPKNGYQIDVCSEKIGLCVQNVITSL